MNFPICSTLPTNLPGSTSKTSHDAPLDTLNNNCTMPSFPTLMRQLQTNSTTDHNNSKLDFVLNSVSIPDDLNDSCSASSGSTAIPICNSPVSVNMECAEAHLIEKPPHRAHDFWDTVLGPSRSVSIVHQKLLPVRNAALKDKPFQCHKCTLSFRKRCNLISHVNNVHEKLRPFYCSICLRKFARKSNCSKHMRIVHRMSREAVKVLRVD